MRRLAAKFAFVHRTLWQRDQAYRWAVLLGPPPLFGCALAALIWAGVQHMSLTQPGQDAGAPWAHWTRPVPQEGQPFAEAPTAALPRTDESGRFVGFQPGWQGTIQPMSVDAVMNVHVVGSVLTNFTLDQPTIPLARILDAGPPTGLFVGIAKAFLVIQTPGLYALSVRLTRSGTQSADCLIGFGSAKHPMVRDVNINTSGQAVLNFRPTMFQLEPGLFRLTVAVGCWRGDHMVGPGEVTVMVNRPGDHMMRPAAADELIRPALQGAGGTDAEATPLSR
jgi:hypothetical protein